MAALVVVSGLPGTGKSTIATRLAIARAAQLVTKDVVEAAVRRRGVTREQGSSWVAHEVLTSLARSAVALDQVVILDTVAGTEQVRGDWRAVCEQTGAAFVVIVCECPDREVHRARLVGRQRGIDGWPELTWADVEATRSRWEPWVDEHLIVDALADVDKNVAAAMRYLDESRSHSPDDRGR